MRGSKAGRMWGRMGARVGGGDAGLGEGARPREVAPHVEHPKVYVFVSFFRNCRGQMGT